MKRAHGVFADDGKWFPSPVECKRYEEQSLRDRLINLSEEQVIGALNRSEPNIYIANAIELAGAIITAKRRESGELKRARKAPAKSDPASQMSAIKENMKAIS